MFWSNVDHGALLDPRPAEDSRGPKYAVVDEVWKSDDYVILANEDWDDRLDRSAARRRKLALDITLGNLYALRASKAPRTILVHTDATAPDERPRTYRLIRKLWLGTGALVLPDVVDEVVVPEERPTPKPLTAKDIRVPLPEGTKRARLRQLDPESALRELRGRKPKPEDIAATRAAVLLIEAETPFAALREHFLTALKALSLKLKEDTKWVDFDAVTIKGQSPGLLVTIAIQPSKSNERVFEVSVTWIVRERRDR